MYKACPCSSGIMVLNLSLPLNSPNSLGVNLANYIVEVVIESKPAARDPEGETIANDLMRKNGYEMVKEVRTARLLRMNLEAGSEEDAKRIADKLCNELRLVNPVSHVYSISIKK